MYCVKGTGGERSIVLPQKAALVFNTELGKPKQETERERHGGQAHSPSSGTPGQLPDFRSLHEEGDTPDNLCSDGVGAGHPKILKQD